MQLHKFQTASMAEKNCFAMTKLIFARHVCHCGAVDKESLARADKPGSTPGDAVSWVFPVSLHRFFVVVVSFDLFGLFFLHYFSFWPFFLHSYC